MKFPVPLTSYTRIRNIIVKYWEFKHDATIADIATFSGMGEADFSKNHSFLIELEILSGGNRKRLTPEGRELGKALAYKISEDIEKNWLAIVKENSFLLKFVSKLAQKGGLSTDECVRTILSDADVEKSKSWNDYKTGAKAILEILEIAKLIRLSDGVFEIANSQIMASLYDTKSLTT